MEIPIFDFSDFLFSWWPYGEDGPGKAVLPKMLVSDVVVYSPRAIHTVVNNGGFDPIKHGQTFSVYNDICRRIFGYVKILTYVTMEPQEITKIVMYRVTFISDILTDGVPAFAQLVTSR